MDSKLYMLRAKNEIKLATIIFTLSTNTSIQESVFQISDPQTYYSAVISHSYYSIFYAAKAYLLKKSITIHAPEEHKKTFDEFSKFVQTGELDVELLKIYQTAIIRAESLLSIFLTEKKKRGEFTYRTLPQANKQPANESLEHASFFFKHIYAII